MSTYRTGLARFFGNQQARIEARLRRPFRTYPGVERAGGLSPRNWQSLMDEGLDDMPSDYINRGEMMRAADFHHRR